MNGATVIFDLDGTMVDTAPDLVAATNHVMRLYGLPPAPPEIIRPIVGYGARAMLAEAAKFSLENLNGVSFEPMLEAFFSHYTDNIAVHSAPFPGLKRQLEALSASGARLGVCTNKREANARRLLSALGLADYFAAVLGGDSLEVRKPDPRHLLATIAAAGGKPHRAAMIGDSLPDVEAARAAAVPCVLVRFGYTPEPVETLGADALIGHFDELDGVLAAIFSPAIARPA